jgi:hypothetical protein
MNEISKPAVRTYFTAHGPDGTVHSGVTETDQVTTSGQPSMESDSDAEAYAAKLEAAGKVDTFPDLPQEGEECEKDQIYNYNGKAVVCYQSHTRTHFAPEDTPALFGLAKSSGDPWVQPQGAHDAYDLGAIVTHNGSTWESNVAANVWEPGVYGWDIV